MADDVMADDIETDDSDAGSADNSARPKRRKGRKYLDPMKQRPGDRIGAFGTNPDAFNRQFYNDHGRMPRPEWTPPTGRSTSRRTGRR